MPSCPGPVRPGLFLARRLQPPSGRRKQPTFKPSLTALIHHHRRTVGDCISATGWPSPSVGCATPGAGASTCHRRHAHCGPCRHVPTLFMACASAVRTRSLNLGSASQRRGCQRTPSASPRAGHGKRKHRGRRASLADQSFRNSIGSKLSDPTNDCYCLGDPRSWGCLCNTSLLGGVLCSEIANPLSVQIASGIVGGSTLIYSPFRGLVAVLRVVHDSSDDARSGDLATIERLNGGLRFPASWLEYPRPCTHNYDRGASFISP
jgi:hypothetical protein